MRHFFITIHLPIINSSEQVKLIPIKVESYSGYKADEHPNCFYLENRRFEITEISDRWYQSDTSTGFPVSDYFKVWTDGNIKCIIKHELESDQWFLVATDELLIPFSSN